MKYIFAFVAALAILTASYMMLHQADIKLGSANVLSTQTTDTIETFRTNVNTSITNLANNSISTSSSYLWSAQQSFANSSSTALSALFAEFGGTSTTTFLKNGRVGFASTSPWGYVSINPTSFGSGPQFAVGSTTATPFIVAGNGNVGVGTSTPGSLFAVQGVANFLTGTSSFIGSTNGLQVPNFAVSNLSAGCIKVGAGGYLQSTGITCANAPIYNNPNSNLSTTQTSTTTVLTIPIPANTTPSSGATYRLSASYTNPVGGGNACMFDIILGDGTASTTVGTVPSFTGLGGGLSRTTINATTTASQQTETESTSIGQAGSVFIKTTPYFGNVNSAYNQTAITYLAIAGKVITSGTCVLQSALLEVFK